MSDLIYGRFTNMNREEVQEYLESWGFAVYDSESLDSLQHAAFENEKTEDKWSQDSARATVSDLEYHMLRDDHYVPPEPANEMDAYWAYQNSKA